MTPGGISENFKDDILDDEVFELTPPKASDEKNSGSMWAASPQDMNWFMTE